ncbi:MAG: hypothetical protein WCJ62_06000 [Flavobacterium sp.]
MKITVFILLFIIIILILRFYFLNIFPLRPKTKEFEYVYVENDGTVRELYSDEKNYLSEEFDNNDGNRPYIKSRYSQLAPDKKISGFIRRVRVPKNIRIHKV